MTLTIMVLRIIHILGGLLWVGITLFNAAYLFPALAAGGSAAAPVMRELHRRRLMVVLPILAILTLLSGFVLYAMVSGGSIVRFAQSATGSAFAAGGAMAVVAFLLGMFVARPAAMRGMQLTQQLAAMPSGADRDAIAVTAGKLARRGAQATMAVSFLLVLAVIGMAIARYL